MVGTLPVSNTCLFLKHNLLPLVTEEYTCTIDKTYSLEGRRREEGGGVGRAKSFQLKVITHNTLAHYLATIT